MLLVVSDDLRVIDGWSEIGGSMLRADVAQ